MALFDQRAQRVARYPGDLRRGVCLPPAEQIKDDGGIVLGDVVQVVGDAAAHHFVRVVPKLFEDREDGRGVFLQRP